MEREAETLQNIYLRMKNFLELSFCRTKLLVRNGLINYDNFLRSWGKHEEKFFSPPDYQHSFSTSISLIFMLEWRLWGLWEGGVEARLSIFLLYNSNYRRHYAILCLMINSRTFFSLPLFGFISFERFKWKEILLAPWSWNEECFSRNTQKTFSIITLNYGRKNLINSENSFLRLSNAAQIFAHQIFLTKSSFLPFHVECTAFLRCWKLSDEGERVINLLLWKFSDCACEKLKIFLREPSACLFLPHFHYISDSRRQRKVEEKKLRHGDRKYKSQLAILDFNRSHIQWIMQKKLFHLTHQHPIAVEMLRNR